MKLSFTITLILMTIISTNAQRLDRGKIKGYEHQLDEVMEIIDTCLLKSRLMEIEQDFKNNPSVINKTKLGIIYHETALNLSFFSSGNYKGYAAKSYEVLQELFISESTGPELFPFIAPYRASALSLMSAETRNLKLLSQAFREFETAVEKYAGVSYCPEFMRGSVAENLPWFFFRKRKFAKIDIQSIIDKQTQNPEFANWKIMSFTYWAWANQHQSAKYRKQALVYLDKTIELDPNYKAGRKRAEELKSKLLGV
jgi:hypothetical protein